MLAEWIEKCRCAIYFYTFTLQYNIQHLLVRVLCHVPRCCCATMFHPTVRPQPFVQGIAHCLVFTRLVPFLFTQLHMQIFLPGVSVSVNSLSPNRPRPGGCVSSSSAHSIGNKWERDPAKSVPVACHMFIGYKSTPRVGNNAATEYHRFFELLFPPNPPWPRLEQRGDVGSCVRFMFGFVQF